MVDRGSNIYNDISNLQTKLWIWIIVRQTFAETTNKNTLDARAKENEIYKIVTEKTRSKEFNLKSSPTAMKLRRAAVRVKPDSTVSSRILQQPA